MSRAIDASTALRQLLEDHDLTQEQFARANEMGIATVNRWVNGKVRVSERKLARAIAAVGIDPADYGIEVVATRITPSTGITNDDVLAAIQDLAAAIDERLTGLEACMCDKAGTVKSLEAEVLAYIRDHQ